VTKTLAYDILLSEGIRLEKVVGMTMMGSGEVWLSYDNDGVGESRLFSIGRNVLP
jgi:hypothetical protein